MARPESGAPSLAPAQLQAREQPNLLHRRGIGRSQKPLLLDDDIRPGNRDGWPSSLASLSLSLVKTDWVKRDRAGRWQRDNRTRLVVQEELDSVAGFTCTARP
jgi:hypothetical protein